MPQDEHRSFVASAAPPGMSSPRSSAPASAGVLVPPPLMARLGGGDGGRLPSQPAGLPAGPNERHSLASNGRGPASYADGGDCDSIWADIVEASQKATSEERLGPGAQEALLRRCDEIQERLVCLGSAVGVAGPSGATSGTTDGQTRTQVLFLVGALSELYLRAHERHATHETWKPPDTFMRRTTKLWVRPERAVEVMCAIGKHLPVLVFGHRQGSALLPPHPLPSGPGRCPSTPDPSSIVQSVYLDSPGMHAYTDRLFRRHNASVLRIRWYGDHVPGPESQVFLERKVHREGWTGEMSVKERCSCPAADAAALAALASKAEADQAAVIKGIAARGGNPDLAAAIAEEVARAGQAPVLRTTYRRMAFQRASGNSIRVSLDLDLTMQREVDGAAGAMQPTHAQQTVANGAVAGPAPPVDFPYIVMEVKLQSEPPAWLLDLVQWDAVVLAPKFSKFLHGAAMLFSERVERTPDWVAADAQGALRGLTFEEMAAAHDSGQAAWALANSIAPGEAVATRLALVPLAAKGPASCGASRTLPRVIQSSEDVAEESHELLSTSQGQGRRVGEARVGGKWSPQDTTTDDMDTEHPNGDGIAFHEQHATKAAARPGLARRVWMGVKARALRVRGGWHRQKSLAEVDLESGSRPIPAKRTPPRPVVRTRVEPKTFFANERTFLSWLSISVLVMFTSLSLIAGSLQMSEGGTVKASSCGSRLSCLGGKVAGVVIAPVAILFMMFSLRTYRRRTALIIAREDIRYDDQQGPLILTVTLVLAMITALVLTLASNFGQVTGL